APSSAIREPSRAATTTVSPSLPAPAISGCSSFTRQRTAPVAGSRRTTVPSRDAAHRLSPASTGWKFTPEAPSDIDQASAAVAGAVIGGGSGIFGLDEDHGHQAQPPSAIASATTAARRAGARTAE